MFEFCNEFTLFPFLLERENRGGNFVLHLLLTVHVVYVKTKRDVLTSARYISPSRPQLNHSNNSILTLLHATHKYNNNTTPAAKPLPYLLFKSQRIT